MANMSFRDRLGDWLMEGAVKHPDLSVDTGHKAPWHKVMCLTGVDYFSTLGYQPGIAILAAGILSPMATLVLVLVTLLAALPTYLYVARYSPEGQGSVSMLERLLPGWSSKIVVLIMLGAAATDFIITITLSSADAAAHIIKNPVISDFFGSGSQMLVSMLLVGALAGIFLKGFKEVIGLAVALVVAYLTLNFVLIAAGMVHILMQPELVSTWWQAATTRYPHMWEMVLVSAFIFPRLALGLSGFETGVMVMRQVDGGDADLEKDADGKSLLKGRIVNTKKLLIGSALIMSFLLITSSFVTTLLVPAEALQHGAEAEGRALAYLAHHLLGNWFGTIYDISTVGILWFAGASAMAGLVNFVPRYLPRYGMAPEWARAVRPLVLVFAVVAFFVTWVFNADVTAQSGAYATGVLILLTAAALSVTLARWNQDGIWRWLNRGVFTLITLVFGYTTLVNIWERPDGIKITSCFILAVAVLSFASRYWRSTELRITKVVLDDNAATFLHDAVDKSSQVRLVAHRPGGSAYAIKMRHSAERHSLENTDTLIMVEVVVDNSSEFMYDTLEVKGLMKGEADHPVLRCRAQAVPNALAALSLHIRDEYGVLPNLYFSWTDGHPLRLILEFLFWGTGEIPLLTRSILRAHEPEQRTRPIVHVA